MLFTGFTFGKKAVQVLANEINFTPVEWSLRSMMGELQASALGADVVYSANMPASYFEQSMQRLNGFMTQRGSGIAAQGLPFTPQGRQAQLPEWKIDPSALPPMPGPMTEQERQILSERYPVGSVPSDSDEGLLDKITKYNPFLIQGGLWDFEFTREINIALFLAVVAVLLVAAGVFSLR